MRLAKVPPGPPPPPRGFLEEGPWSEFEGAPRFEGMEVMMETVGCGLKSKRSRKKEEADTNKQAGQRSVLVAWLCDSQMLTRARLEGLGQEEALSVAERQALWEAEGSQGHGHDMATSAMCVGLV